MNKQANYAHELRTPIHDVVEVLEHTSIAANDLLLHPNFILLDTYTDSNDPMSIDQVYVIGRIVI